MDTSTNYSSYSDPGKFNFQESINTLGTMETEISSMSETSGVAKFEISTTMQEKLTNIVNNLTTQRDNIKTAKEALKGRVRFRHPFKTAAKVKALTKQLGQVKQTQSYAIKLQSQATSHQMAATREMHQEDVSDTPITTQHSVDDLMAAANKLKKELKSEIKEIATKQMRESGGDIFDLAESIELSSSGTISSEDSGVVKLEQLTKQKLALDDLKDLVTKFSRSDDLRDINANELNDLNTLVELFDSMDMEDASPELKQLASLVKDMKQEVDTAFERGMDHLSGLKMEGKTMKMLQDIGKQKELNQQMKQLSDDIRSINTNIEKLESSDTPDAHRSNIEQKLPKDTLETLKSEFGETEQYDAKLIEAAKEHVSNLDSEMQEVLKALDKLEPKTNEEKIEWFSQSNELMSAFSDPFEPHIGIEGFCNSVLAALDGEESAFSEQIEKMGTTEKSELREKVELLKNASSQIKDMTTGQQYKAMRNDPELRPKMIEAKNTFLKNKRAQNKVSNNKSVSVNIIGGGPGGMIRSLIAGVKGHKGMVIEMREDYTRDNMVKLSETPTMKYFGVRERLVEKGLINKDSSSIEVKLKDLEDTLDEIAQEIYGDDDYRVTGQVIDVLPGSDGKANCLVKKGKRRGPKKDVVMSADLHVDSTGARADMGKMLEVGTQKLANSQMMVALVMKKESSSKGSSTGTEFSASIPLSTPDQNYSLIQPSVENQTKLRELNEQRSQLWSEITSLNTNIGKVQNSSFPELYRGNIEGRLPENTLKQLKNDYGGTKQYDAKLIEAAKKHITGLESKKKEVEGKTETILYTIASEQQGKTITKSDVKQIAPFNIELHQRDQPSVVYGKSVMMYSGDSLATPDPKSGAGAGHALAGGTLFSKVLDDQDNGRTPDQIRTRFNHGSELQTKQVTGQGISSRKQIKTEDPGLTTTYILGQSESLGFIDHDDNSFIQIMASKKEHGGAINEQEKEKLGTILDKLSDVQVFGSAKTATLGGLKDLIGKLKE